MRLRMAECAKTGVFFERGKNAQAATRSCFAHFGFGAPRSAARRTCHGQCSAAAFYFRLSMIASIRFS